MNIIIGRNIGVTFLNSTKIMLAPKKTSIGTTLLTSIDTTLAINTASIKSSGGIISTLLYRCLPRFLYGKQLPINTRPMEYYIVTSKEFRFTEK